MPATPAKVATSRSSPKWAARWSIAALTDKLSRGQDRFVSRPGSAMAIIRSTTSACATGGRSTPRILSGSQANAA
jgi:hypothetical protein